MFFLLYLYLHYYYYTTITTTRNQIISERVLREEAEALNPPQIDPAVMAVAPPALVNAAGVGGTVVNPPALLPATTVEQNNELILAQTPGILARQV